MISLWPFQQACVADIRAAFKAGHKSVLLQSATGSGKTIMFSFITHNHIQRKENPHVLILVHRQELLDQVVEALGDQGIKPSIIDGKRHEYGHSHATVGSVFTVARRLDRVRRPTLLIIDEAHHAASGTTWGRVATYYAGIPTLGVSATPARLDGAGLGHTFSALVCGPKTSTLIADGYLAPLRVFAPPTTNSAKLHRRFGEFMRGELIELMDKPTITGDAIEHYRWYGQDKRAVVFCVSVEHAHNVAKSFSDAGFPAFALDGQLDRDVRRDRVAAFRAGRVQILTSCDLISEGFDVPDIECGISLRPTSSLGLWYQQIGRCMRRAPGKTHALILDHAGNSVRHGLPTDDIEWSLGKGVAHKQAKGAGIKLCTHCFATNAVHARECCECHKPFKTEARVVASVKGELTEMSVDDFKQLQAQRAKRREVGMADDLNALRKIESDRGYKKGWAEHQYAAKQRKKVSASAS